MNESQNESQESEESMQQTTDDAKDIKAINKDTVHRICSGQVVLNLASAVKELVENSIDAGATLVEIKLKDQGLEQIEIADNGCGVDENNFVGLTAKYHTSKLREFTDLVGVTTFGFRGEALSSLCALSDLLITTRHKTKEICGTRLEYDHYGNIKNKSICAREVGTTVTLTNLFSTLPVRKKEFHKNIKREFIRMCQVLQGYCLVATGVRIICTNQTKKGAKTTVMSTPGSNSVLDNIIAIFGSKQCADIIEIKTINQENGQIDDNGGGGGGGDGGGRSDTSYTKPINQIKGFISSCNHGSGRSSRDRQFFYINSRPCEPKKIIKLINETYHRYNLHQMPFVYLNLIIKREEIDINLTPDKRQILVNNENKLFEMLKQCLELTFEDIPSTFRMQNLDLLSLSQEKNEDQQMLEEKSQLVVKKSADFLKNENNESISVTLSETDDIINNIVKLSNKSNEIIAPIGGSKKRKSSNNEINIKNIKMKKIQEYLSKSSNENDVNSSLNEENSDNENVHVTCRLSTPSSSKFERKLITEKKSLISSNNTDAIAKSELKQIEIAELEIEEIVRTLDKPSSSIQHIINNGNNTADTDDDDVILCGFKSQSTLENKIKISTSVTKIRELMQRDQQSATKLIEKQNIDRLKFKAIIDPSKNKIAEQELQTEITKEQFLRMEIIGQFNLGFIIVRLEDDLFIIDQHASDEKFNFETLEKTTQLQSQPLVHPQPLELTAVNEMILIDNREIFELNGFKFQINDDALPTKKCKLIAKPFSKNWEFGKDDVDELLFMLHDAPGEMCRPSRIRSMFASRACRKSVMIGTALSTIKMKRLVEQMGEIENPWNCPHGRPTMRHLINIAMLNETINE